jgi:uncharacterized membrane protein (DUF2068 family)
MLPQKPERPRFVFGVRLIAVLEGAKALVVLIAGFGVLSLLHRDVAGLVTRWVEFLHFNPLHKYPQVFIAAARELTDTRLWLLAFAALVYSTIRGIEAVGLWFQRAWASWLGVLTGGIYLPFEIYELAHGFTLLKLSAFLVNVAVIAYLAFTLRRERAREIGNRE